MTEKPKRGTFNHTHWMIEEINRVSDETGVRSRAMTRAFFIDRSDATRTDVDACNGWGPIRALAAASQEDELTQNEQGQRRSVHHANRHRRALERQIGDIEYFTDRLHGALSDAVSDNPPKISRLKKAKLDVTSLSPAKREIVAFISDTHFGARIDPMEIIGQQYNWTIAARRMSRFCLQVANYKKSKRKGTSLRLVLNGDLIEGKIHNDDNGVDLLANQIDGTRQILTSMIDFFRHHFDVINVECQTGNHGRWPFKGHGRATAQKYDSAAVTIFRGMEAIFRDCNDVHFNIPRTPWCTFKLCGEHTTFVTHGDTVFSAGSPGKSLNIEKLTRQIFKLNASPVTKDPVKLVLLGHYHIPLWTKLEDGSDLVINGCASGTNGFAQSIGIFGGTPTQVFFESTEQYPVGDFRIVNLAVADSEEALDEVVPPPMPIGMSLPQTPQAANTDFHAWTDAVSKLTK